MPADVAVSANVKQAVPFFGVTDIEASLRFYVDGLGCVVANQWSPEGRIRWCWLRLGDAALMLQEYAREGRHAGAPDGPRGQGVSICFMCADAIAIYRDLISRGIAAQRPFVGNGLWVTSVSDPDGYRLDFESPTDVAEETVYSDAAALNRSDAVPKTASTQAPLQPRSPPDHSTGRSRHPGSLGQEPASPASSARQRVLASSLHRSHRPVASAPDARTVRRPRWGRRP